MPANIAVAAMQESMYERMTGSCTRTLASNVLELPDFQPPIADSSHVLDLACGPGIVTCLIKSAEPKARVVAADISPRMIEEVDSLIEANSWTNVSTVVLDLRDLSRFEDGIFSHVFVNLGLPVPNDPDEGGAPKALKEWRRVLKPGGLLVLTSWADRVWPTAFMRVAKAIRPYEAYRNPLAIEPKFMKGSWLLDQLEQVFGRDVMIRCENTATMAVDLKTLVKNMMMARESFFPGYIDDEIELAEAMLEKELRCLPAFVENTREASIQMKAWVGIARKSEDYKNPVC